MPEHREHHFESYISLYDNHTQNPITARMVADGDMIIYDNLHPLSESAFNYRDSIDIGNHVSGIEAIKRYIPKSGTMLYLASSYGLAPVSLKEEGYNVVSLDRDYSALHFAGYYTDKQINADAENLPFANEVFSSVVSRDFLAKDYYLLSRKDKKSIINEIHRVLKKDGKAIFYTLYTAETEKKDEKPITEGLPDVSLLSRKFNNVQKVEIIFTDQPERNTIAYVVTK